MKAYYKVTVITQKNEESERRVQRFRTDIRFLLESTPKLIEEDNKLYLLFAMMPIDQLSIFSDRLFVTFRNDVIWLEIYDGNRRKISAFRNVK